MRIQRVLTGIVLACGMIGTVQAATLASGPVFGGPSQDHVACQVFNVGNTPITFVSTEFFNQSGRAIPLTFDNCGESLASNSICTFQAAAGNQAYGCKVRINEGKANVRGTMAALTSSNVLLSEADLR
jgi:hypothetical protein